LLDRIGVYSADDTGITETVMPVLVIAVSVTVWKATFVVGEMTVKHAHHHKMMNYQKYETVIMLLYSFTIFYFSTT